VHVCAILALAVTGLLVFSLYVVVLFARDTWLFKTRAVVETEVTKKLSLKNVGVGHFHEDVESFVTWHEFFSPQLFADDVPEEKHWGLPVSSCWVESARRIPIEFGRALFVIPVLSIFGGEFVVFVKDAIVDSYRQIQSWTFANIAKERPSPEEFLFRTSRLVVIRNVPLKICDSNPWSIVNTHRLGLVFVRLDHLLQLARINARYSYRDNQDEDFSKESKRVKMWSPPWRIILGDIGIVMFAWGRWITTYTRRRVGERTAILGFACMVYGVILTLWSI
jgi:hypothetical protein